MSCKCHIRPDLGKCAECTDATILELRAQVRELEVRLEANTKDAARYRWLRELGAIRCALLRKFLIDGVPEYQTEMLDAAIDAALKGGDGGAP